MRPTNRSRNRLAGAILVGLLTGPVGAWNLVDVDTVSDVGDATCLMVADGAPAIAYVDRSAAELKFVRAVDADGSAWGPPIVVAATAGGRLSLGMALGHPAVAYQTSAGSIRFVRATDPQGSAWGAGVDLGAGSLDRDSMEVVNGNPAIAFRRNQDLYYLRADDAAGASWPAPSSVFTAGATTGVALEVVSGNPAVLFANSNGGDEQVLLVRATDPDGTAWGSAVVVYGRFPESTRADLSLLVVDGNPAAAFREIDWYSGYSASYYLRADDPLGGQWSTMAVISFLGYNESSGFWPAVADVGGRPFFTQHHRLPDRSLHLRRGIDAGGTAFTPEVMVDVRDSGGGSVAEVNGHPGISYFGLAGGTLRYAWVQCPPVSVTPQALPNGTAGSAYSAQFAASGGAGPYTFSAETPPPGLTLSPSGALSGVPAAAGSFTFRVTVQDSEGCQGWVDADLTVDCNASCTLTLSPSTLPDATIFSSYSQTLGAAGGAAPYQYAVVSGSLPPGIVLSGGDLQGTPTAHGTWTFTIEATDSCGCQGTQVFTLTVNCYVPFIRPASLRDAPVGAPLQRELTASHGNLLEPVAWSVAGGTSLPPGLTLVAGGPNRGILFGIPRQAGLFSFTVQATDARGCSGTEDYSIRFNCQTIGFDPSGLPGGRVGEAYSQAFAANAGIPPFQFSVVNGQLPAGLALSPSGVLSGTPSAVGAFSFDVQMAAGSGCKAVQAYLLQVGAGEPANYVTGAGNGQPNPNRVTVHDASGAPTSTDFSAYGAGQWGVNVSSGELGSGLELIVTGPGPGPGLGPQVRAFDRSGGPIAKVNFFAYGTLRYGVNVAGGDLDGDGLAEILTGGGPGQVFGPHARGWDYDGLAVGPMARVNFFAYGTPRFGVGVATANVDGDGFEEILTGPGPSPVFAATVRGFDSDGGALSPLPGLNFNAFPGLWGVIATGGDVVGNGRAAILAAQGPFSGLDATVKGFSWDSGSVAALAGFDVRPFVSSYGARIATGDRDGDGVSELVVAPGPDPGAASTIGTYSYQAGAVTPVGAPFVPFSNLFHGANVATERLGF